MPTMPLTQQNFQTVVATNHIVLVDFWATWCGWCTRFAPVYEASAETHPDIVHATVEAEAEPALAAAGQVDRYPWVMVFREGLLVYSKAGFLPGDQLEELVQQVRWMDMETFRREHGQQAGGEKGPVVEDQPAGRAGPAPGPHTYGWPGLRSA
ncbi:thioredoxin domain-containing protein [Nocardia sp. NPDC019395]|uniref:thioredoxin family protein n=1 Tax=Nocardia sp. NPDC019395 TaxID=3154686 RepID=UPI0033F5E1E2